MSKLNEAEFRGAQQQFERMMCAAQELFRQTEQEVDPVSRQELLHALQCTQPRQAIHAEEAPEPSSELVRALQYDLVGTEVLDPLTRGERERVLARQAPERWARNLLRAMLMKAKETPHNIPDE